MTPRIVHYYPRAGVGDGGCTSAVHGWATAVANTGAQVTVISDGTGKPPDVRHVRWLTTPHQASGRMRAPVGLDKLLHDSDVLVLHSGWVYHNVRAARFAAASAVPYLLTPHGAYDPNVFRRRRMFKRAWWNLLERQLVTRAWAIHLFFDEQRDEMKRLGYAGPVIVAPTGLTIPDFKTQSGRSPFLLWMGRFDIETKGLDLLLHALASLPANARPRARLHGPDWRGGKQQTTQLVRQLGLEDFVDIGPPLYGSEKWDALRECGLFAFPSRWDAQSVMLLEAAAAGAPMIVTRATPFGRYLTAQRAAIGADATPDSIASAIRRVCSSSEGDEFGERAARLVRERFAWPAVAESYAQQLRTLL
jgi:glycosyltransferase involved in cell wall biosynthesis